MNDSQTRATLIEAAATAIERELMRQYRDSDWDDAEDVMEGVDYCLVLQAALAAIEAHDGGCVVVPREATDQMLDAAAQAVNVYAGDIEQWNVHGVLVAASPYAPPPQEKDEA